MAEAKTKEPQAAGGSGKGMKILIGVMALLLMVAVGAVSYLLGHRSAPAAATAENASNEHTPGHADEKSESSSESKGGGHDALYLALDPPFVVNFQSDTAARFLQVGVQLMARDQKALDAAKASEPAVRNALVMLFSSQDAKTLISREGKEKLRSDSLDEIRKIVADRTKGATIDAVYFTSFVMQ